MTAIDRRVFLSASLAAAATPAFLRADAPTPAKLRLGAQSYTFREFDLLPALKRMQQLGLTFGEFYSKHLPQTTDEKKIKAFLGTCKEFGVTPWAWGVQRFTKDHDANKKVFDFGKAVGLKMFSADPTPDAFDSLDKLCAEYKIAVGIHPHGPVGGKKLHAWYSAEVILKAVKDHHELIGSCLDTGHLIRCAQLDKKLDPAEQIRVMGKRNFGLHLKDHDNKRNTDVVFGKGVLDVASVIKALREVKFDGMISIEYEASPKEPTEEVKACVAVFNKAHG